MLKESCINCRYNIDNRCCVNPLSTSSPAIISKSYEKIYRCSMYERKLSGRSDMLLENNTEKDNKE